MYLEEFLLVALVHLLAVMSPGPDFAVVIRNSVSLGRQIGLMTAAGIGTGILVHVAYSLLGIGLIVSQSVWLFNLMKWAAAAYLLYIGLRALRSQPQVLNAEGSRLEQLSPRRAFTQGFITNGLNPKATLFFLSLFTVVISHDTPLPVQAGYGLYLAFATGAWFCLVAALFSHPRVRRAFSRMGHWFDRAMGLVLVGLGVRLALSQWLERSDQAL